jgi:hypothetical protein
MVVTSLSLLSLPATAEEQVLSLTDIVGRMEQTQKQWRMAFIGYSATREYQLSLQSARGEKPESWVMAEVNSFAPTSMYYTTRRTYGSERGEMVVRKVLEHESRMRAHPEQVSVSSRNYNFMLLGRETIGDQDCYILQLQPKRQVEELVRGKVWVSTSDFTVRRIDGEPAKSPSWWIKRLHITINYGRRCVDGARNCRCCRYSLWGHPRSHISRS